MKFNEDTHRYLKGDSFSNGLKVSFADDNSTSFFRMDLLERIATNKKVIHVGFADHIPLIKSKIENGFWLHKKLVDKASLCIGLDINEEAVKYVKENFGIKNVYNLDIIQDNVPEYLQQQWDYLIIGEVLEHIDNPVLFLQNIKHKYKSYVNELIITVPNAFALQNLLSCFKGLEFINTDHRFWFTPYTLAKVASQSGFTVNEFHLGQMFYGNQSWWRKKLLKKYPLLRENIMMLLGF